MEENKTLNNEGEKVITNKKRSTKLKLNIIIPLIFSLISLIGVIYTQIQIIDRNKIIKTISDEYLKLKTQLDDANDSLNKIQVYIKDTFEILLLIPNGDVDLTMNGMQDIGDGFYCTISNVSEHLSGIKIEGLVLNAKGITISNIVFKAKINDIIKDINYPVLKNGFAGKFTLYFPDTNASTNSINIKYDSSYINYSYQ